MAHPVYYIPAGDVLPIYFSTYAGATGESVTCTGLAVTDIEVYKDASMTQRASDAGFVLIDTDGIDIDGVTGVHGFTIDTGDNTDASFYTVGAWFTVVVSAITVDSQTISFIAAQFRIMAAEGVAGVPDANLTHIADATVSTAAAQLGVNVVNMGGSAGTFASGRPEVNTTHAAGTAWNSGAITAATLADDASDEIRDKVALRTTLRGTCTTGGSTTSITTSAMSPATSVADQLKGRIVLFDHNTTTASLRGQATDITASSASATPTLTVSALTTAPASGDTFTVV